MSNAGVFLAGVSLIAGEYQRIQIDPHKLKFYRSRIEPTDEGELKALNERRTNLARSWLEQPIHDIYIRDGDFAVADGNERVAGLLLLGVDSISVVLLPADTSDAELDDFSLLTDFHKASLKPIERATVAKRRLDATGMKKGELAAKLRIDQGYLTRLLSLFDCPQQAQDEARLGRITVDDWYSISKSPQPLETLRLRLSGASRSEVRASAKAKKTPAEGGKPPEKFDRLPILFPEAVVLVKAKKGEQPLTLAATKQILKDALGKVEEAIERGYALKTALRSFADTKDKVKTPRKKRETKTSD